MERWACLSLPRQLPASPPGPCVNSVPAHDFPDVATSCANAPTVQGQDNGKGYGQLNRDVH